MQDLLEYLANVMRYKAVLPLREAVRAIAKADFVDVLPKPELVGAKSVPRKRLTTQPARDLPQVIVSAKHAKGCGLLGPAARQETRVFCMDRGMRVSIAHASVFGELCSDEAICFMARPL